MYVRAGDSISLYVDGVIVASANALCTDARLDVPFQIERHDRSALISTTVTSPKSRCITGR